MKRFSNCVTVLLLAFIFCFACFGCEQEPLADSHEISSPGGEIIPSASNDESSSSDGASYSFVDSTSASGAESDSESGSASQEDSGSGDSSQSSDDEPVFPEEEQTRSGDVIDLPTVPLRRQLTQLTAVGENFVNEYGDKVLLRGVNAGGLCVPESWMNIFRKDYADNVEIRDQMTLNKIFLERFGVEKTKALWEEYKRTYWTKEDFEICKEMGINVIRLPFSYMDVDFDAVLDMDNAGKNYDFSFIENFVNTAAKYGIYTVLDLHGAYGSQNGQNHSGQYIADPADIDFYSNDRKKQLTVDLWKAVATRFKDNVYVAAFDILNEPAERLASGQQTTEKHWAFFNEIYQAIREIDKKHVIIFESCWSASQLPAPSKYGWTNCAYSMHEYTGTASSYEQNTTKMTSTINSWKAKKYNVPLFMGEFTCYFVARSWDYCLDLFEANNISFCSWSYKRTFSNAAGASGWNIVLVQRTEEERVDALNDSYETIIAKFQTQITKAGDKDLYPVPNDIDETDQRTLFDIFKQHLIK